MQFFLGGGGQKNRLAPPILVLATPLGILDPPMGITVTSFVLFWPDILDIIDHLFSMSFVSRVWK